MTGPLDGVKLKIERAGEHRETFERELLEFFRLEPERAVAKLNEQGPDHYADIALIEPLPPGLSCILGDFVQNLRQAFDHFVWAAALRSRPNPPRKIAFPICRDGTAWTNYIASPTANQTKKAVGSDAWKLITELQPYKRATPDSNPDTDPLWALNELARIDRHQTLHLTIAKEQGTFVGFGPMPRLGNIISWPDGWPVAPGEPGIPRFATPTLNDPATGQWTVTDDGVQSQIPSYDQVLFEVVLDPDAPFAPNTWVSPMLTALFESVKFFCLPRMEMVFTPKP